MDFKKYRFVYNAAAHFAAKEKCPDLMESLVRDDIEGLKTLCWLLEELSTQGDLVRRNLGYDKGEIIKADVAMVELKPYEILEAKQIVVNAIQRGMAPSEEEEIDEVLMELQKKTVKR
jgi:hypothetical protein